MVDQFYGLWKWDPTTPEKDWCDCDYVADFIVESHYVPQTSIENVVYNIIAFYEDYLAENDVEYYCIEKDTRSFPMNLMIHMTDVSWFVRDSGGLKEFDFEI